MRTMQEDVKIYLLRNGMTQKAFARLVGINQGALSEFLHRKNGTTIAERIAPYIYRPKDLKDDEPR